MPARPCTRRAFLASMAAAAAGTALARPAACLHLAAPAPRTPICIFSKHLQWLDYAGMAERAAAMGFDGIDLTVRPKGHVLPERVEDDLPRAVEAVRRAGLEVPMIVTAINDPDDRHTEPILRTAAALGIRYYRMGYWQYDLSRPIPPQVEALKPRMRALADLNARYGICGEYQNHAGSRYVGAPVWDLWALLEDLDPRWTGCQFDVRHATVEGGSSWPIEFRLVAPRIHTVIAKDFAWETTDEGLRARNVPLGEGVVRFPAYFEMLKGIDFAGPISVHYEYGLGGAEHGAGTLTVPETLVTRRMEADLLRLRHWLAEAGLA